MASEQRCINPTTLEQGICSLAASIMPQHLGTALYEHAIAPELVVPREAIGPFHDFVLPDFAQLSWKQMHPHNELRLDAGSHLMVTPFESVGTYGMVKYLHHFTVPSDSGEVMVYRHCKWSYAPLLVRRMPGRILVLNIEVTPIDLPPNETVAAVKLTACYLSGVTCFEKVHSTLDGSRVAEVREHIRAHLINMNMASINSDIRLILVGQASVLRGNARLWIYRPINPPAARRARGAQVLRRPSAAVSIRTYFR